MVEIWQQLPVAAFVLAAGLASLPVDMYKAAAVDGASRWQTFRMITLPLLKPVILVVLLLRIMDAFKVFDIVFMLTYGGPGQRTEVLSLLIYKTGLEVSPGRTGQRDVVALPGLHLRHVILLHPRAPARGVVRETAL